MPEPNATVAEIRAFMDRFRGFAAARSQIRLNQFRAGFGQLQQGLKRLNAARLQVEREEAPRHNIFSILGVAAHENRTHTPMLAYLLNPRATHGQGCLFLREFLSQCGRMDGFPQPTGDVESGAWFVDTQKVTASGTMDLVISSPSLRYLLVVENKIYAPEGADQVMRHHRWLESRRVQYERRALIFLTPEGREASSAPRSDYFPMSYRQDVQAMLRLALPSVEAPGVRETVRQYLAIIESL